ncbi:hypothetical protein Clacol_005814 [Clathrus columnatus]|uniref:Major facilitator superfamily (MFS) profile domain-containing protein n=1 Tax=Clathrus columnatus TaxID=1419009 RepID=A0AAV5AAE2_9AGAM|nr:hypothetical protein Clacol_005814 [Clathrus columnatus]
MMATTLKNDNETAVVEGSIIEETKTVDSAAEKTTDGGTPKGKLGELGYLDGWPLFVVMAGLLLCLFLPALDQLILTTAIPHIVSQFNSLDEISWIPNAYFVTMACFMIIFGQTLNLVPLKYFVLASVFIFELGSLFCGVAFNINFLLFGRGVAGIGAAGLFVAIFTAVAQIAPLEKRPKLLGLAGTVFGLTSVIGPLVGGALTDASTWRWCFYINLPIGGFAALVIVFFLPNYPAPPRPANRQGWRVFLSIDYVGALLVIGATIMFLYALVEGGNTHPWNSAIIISFFIVSGILAILFVLWSWVSNVYLATWYQAIKGVTPTKSGVDVLPLSLVTSAFALLSGVFVGKVGRYWHIMVLLPLVGAVAAGLEFTINEQTSEARLAGYQVLWAISIGSTLQLPTLAGQAEYENNLIDTRYATSLIAFIGFLGRMVGLGMGSALFTNKLGQYLKELAPDAPFDLVLRSITAVWQLPLDQRTRVVHAYVLALRFIFILGVPAGGLASLSALLIRNRKIQKAPAPDAAA